MLRSPEPRKPANLSKSLDRQLNSYAFAASAAGVGMLALGQSADAKIVYTPDHQNILPNHTILLDLNHDGVADFIIQDIHSTSQAISHKGLLSEIPGRVGNAAEGFSGLNRNYASALQSGASIGPGGKFGAGEKVIATIFSDTGARQGTGATNGCNGPWDKQGNYFLGLKFIIQGEPHFGWARLSVRCNSREVGALLSGYAFETIPYKPIIAGQTSSADDDASANAATLGGLALGRK